MRKQVPVNRNVSGIELIKVLARLNLISIIGMEADSRQSILRETTFDRKVVIVVLCDFAIGVVTTRARKVSDSGIDSWRRGLRNG